VIALAAHLLHHVARLRCRFVAIKLDEQVSRSDNVEAPKIDSAGPKMK
jgi:hypothetical protein